MNNLSKNFPPYVGKLTYLDASFATAHVNRYHMVRMVRQQSVAEHSLRVGYIFRQLFSMWRKWDAGLTDSTAIQSAELYGIKLAMDHDSVEAMVGDIPGHIKSDAMREALDVVEKQAMSYMCDYSIHMAYMDEPDDPTGLRGLVRYLVKLSDLAEGYVFSYYNQGLGNLVDDNKREWVNGSWVSLINKHLENRNPDLIGETLVTEFRFLIVMDRLGITPQNS